MTWKIPLQSLFPPLTHKKNVACFLNILNIVIINGLMNSEWMDVICVKVALEEKIHYDIQRRKNPKCFFTYFKGFLKNEKKKKSAQYLRKYQSNFHMLT